MNFLRILILTTAMLLMAETGMAQDDPLFGGFDGRWQGTMRFIDPGAYSEDFGINTPSAECAIAIQGETANVSSFVDGEWHDIGTFRMFIHESNAVLFAQHSGLGTENGERAGWVETWNFTVTHKDDNALLVAFSRSVNNVHKAFDDKGSDGRGRFFAIGFGQLDKTENVTGTP